ncbi:MAG: zinc metalloprotease [Desulfofustis sp.]|nr:zinc metalloprotease [Desulfofustis sp.]
MLLPWSIFWIFTAIVIGPLCFPTILSARDDGSSLSYAVDGSVTIEAMHFDSLEAYITSDYFKTTGKRCGTVRPDSLLQSHLLAAQDCTETITSIRQEYWPESVVYLIPVYVHVISKTDGTGDISDQRILSQIEVLNEDFRALSGSLGSTGVDTHIQFELIAITRRSDDIWFQDQDEDGYKRELGVDPSRYLNIYTNTASGYLGYSYLPFTDAGTLLDGVTMLHDAIGGRDEGIAPYNQGRTLTHEIGHYLGLHHTFDSYGALCGNGYDSGDLIVDTPAESEEHYGCTPSTTCNSADPIDNYMNYTDDLCMERFTGEQANRMVCALVNYRPLLYRTVVLGDLDQNNQVTLEDLILALKVVTNQSAFVDRDADATRDRHIGLPDALYILDKVAAP